MALAIVYSRASFGIQAPLVTVETHLYPGVVGFNIVGLPEAAVKESRDRVRSALLNSHFEFPIRRIVVNLAPADLPKEGGRFDLPIALGILAASGQLPKENLAEYEFVGELSLTGDLRPIRGVLPVALAAYQAGRQLMIPIQNAQEAALVSQTTLFASTHILEICAHLTGKCPLTIFSSQIACGVKHYQDLADVKGQTHAKRALEIAATGQHSVLFIGPPGTGKTTLANCLPSILPDISDQEAIEIAAIASVSSNGFKAECWQQVPFRSPHHTSSSIALVGGGRPPKPGEISLAHRGVLFLDELPEFDRYTLESLREPLESGCITISRAAFQTVFPAQFQLIAAMNPCPCGYAGSAISECQCSGEQIKRYLKKISGPLLERIDMHIEVAQIAPHILIQDEKGECSKAVRQRVIMGRHCQLKRQNKCNSALSISEVENICKVQPNVKQLLYQVLSKFNLSARTYHRLIKVARTIADLTESEVITEKHIAETLNYRCLDRARMISL
ncbi:MAG: ATP-dependent protease [Gammaproteobacteria bacterium RIFCSPHIGHO2_12_FULL_37_34]|nr:MAG: ATP-dependent protease [Gammaproteobacteria bacterium RIFCSPHIGHO2_12_FULL_37_34]